MQGGLPLGAGMYGEYGGILLGAAPNPGFTFGFSKRRRLLSIVRLTLIVGVCCVYI